MDKRVMFAVAGSGKTTKLVDEIDTTRRFLVLTYTDENYGNLRRKISLEHGVIPENVTVMTYFTFLHSFCFRPLAGLKVLTKGLNYIDEPPRGRFKDTQLGYYVDPQQRLYAARVAKLLGTTSYFQDVLKRIERFFDVVLVDEVQDFAGHDFNLLLSLGQAQVSMLLVGDFRQHTYDTSRDGSTNKSLHDDYNKYIKRFEDAEFEIDTTTLFKSRRCSPAVCTFITEELGIPIETWSVRESSVTLIETEEDAHHLRARDDVVKLFYKKHYEYGCYSQNWGASKGEDHYDEVCIVLNKTSLTSFRTKRLRNLAPSTLNKLYVALSRSRGNVYLVPHFFYD